MRGAYKGMADEIKKKKSSVKDVYKKDSKKEEKSRLKDVYKEVTGKIEEKKSHV